MPDSTMFFTFEGLDGSGKSSLIDVVYNKIMDLPKRYKVFKFSDFRDTQHGSRIRKILADHRYMNPRARSALIISARLRNLDDNILPALRQKNSIVLQDRWNDSTIAYHLAGNHGNEDIFEELKWIKHFCQDLCPVPFPKRTFLLDVSVKESLRRCSSRGCPDEIERMPMEYHSTVREAYQDLATENPRRIQILNGLDSLESLAEQVMESIFNCEE